ncbi:MAG: type II toxin-antitoxin system RelE/ParE family toxin [Desulfobulbaceae bacterium]|nr:type II toxin-antitoxin system RelE/ParE family toxin [Desulfobulbaceae bacterium]
MTKRFAKWSAKQKIHSRALEEALSEVISGNYGVNLGGNVYKKRIRFEGQGKSGSGRTIICYKTDDRAIFVHGFTKKEKSNLSDKELVAFKELAKILLNLSSEDLDMAISSGALREVRS